MATLVQLKQRLFRKHKRASRYKLGQLPRRPVVDLARGRLEKAADDSAGSMISEKCAYWSNSSSPVPWLFRWVLAPIGIHLFADKRLTTQKQFEASRRLLQKLKEMPLASPIT